MKFSLSIGNTPSVISKLEDNDIDIALVESEVENNNLLIEKFSEDELILVAPMNHRWKDRKEIGINELTEEKMIWRESDSGTRLIVENALKEVGILDRIESAIELGSMQSIKNAVEAELGVSILPKLTIVKELKYGTFLEIKISNFKLTRNFWMVQKQHRLKKTGINDFVHFIRGY